LDIDAPGIAKEPWAESRAKLFASRAQVSQQQGPTDQSQAVLRKDKIKLQNEPN
jgi:hypothetical protein